MTTGHYALRRQCAQQRAGNTYLATERRATRGHVSADEGGPTRPRDGGTEAVRTMMTEYPEHTLTNTAKDYSSPGRRGMGTELSQVGLPLWPSSGAHRHRCPGHPQLRWHRRAGGHDLDRLDRGRFLRVEVTDKDRPATTGIAGKTLRWRHRSGQLQALGFWERHRCSRHDERPCHRPRRLSPTTAGPRQASPVDTPPLHSVKSPGIQPGLFTDDGAFLLIISRHDRGTDPLASCA